MTYREEWETDQAIRDRFKAERFPVKSVDGAEDDPTACVDGAGQFWPEHDDNGNGACRRCDAELYDPYEDGTPWLVTDSKIDRYEEEQGY